MEKIDFRFTVECPACKTLFEVSHWAIEVVHDGLEIGKCEKCGLMVTTHLICAIPDVAITCANCGEYHSIYLPCKGGKQETATQVI